MLWTLGLPLIWLYLRRRARKDRDYAAHLGERLGLYPRPLHGAVWVHAVSLGEIRSAVPLIRKLLDAGEKVVTTHFTPAGRREALVRFAPEIAAGRMQVVWVPLETAWAYRGFWRAFRPRFGFVMEVEIWPRMVFAARAAGVPLYMCNAQYPRNAFARDRRDPLRLRHEVMRHYTGALVKSDLQAHRFASVGVTNITVTGELRFEQPIPQAQVDAGQAARIFLGAQKRRVIAFASTIEGEDDLFTDAIRALKDDNPLIIYIPRRPERFESVAQNLVAPLRRSDLWDDALAPQIPAPENPQIILGDSLGEMYFYLAMADIVVVGGGFSPKGAHNISEALALGKPVITGPYTHTIEYPFEEARSAGVALSVTNSHDLAQALRGGFSPHPDQISAFFEEHTGATQKTLRALPNPLSH